MREVAESGLPDDGVESLFQDEGGRIWAFTENGAAYFENGRFIPVTTNRARVDDVHPRQLHVTGVFGLVAPGGQVHSITGDSSGNIWISDQHQGLFHLLGGRVVDRIPWDRLGRTGLGYGVIRWSRAWRSMAGIFAGRRSVFQRWQGPRIVCRR